MINIYFNNESHRIQPQSLEAFLLNKNYINLHFAVALNDQFIPHTAYSTTLLSDGDRLDIIVPMQGG